MEQQEREEMSLKEDEKRLRSIAAEAAGGLFRPGTHIKDKVLIGYELNGNPFVEVENRDGEFFLKVCIEHSRGVNTNSSLVKWKIPIIERSLGTDEDEMRKAFEAFILGKTAFGLSFRWSKKTNKKQGEDRNESGKEEKTEEPGCVD